MARTDGRVNLGKNPKEKLDNAIEIAAKHKEMGAQSPLNVLEEVDWKTLQPKVEAALQAHNDAESHKLAMEKAYRERDAVMPEIEKALKASVKLLKASFNNNPKKLGDWGITVNDSPPMKAASEKKPQ